MTEYPIQEEGGFKFLDIGPKDTVPVLLLHGLFGTASNFDCIISHFQEKRRLLLPILPIFEMSIRTVSLGGLFEYVKKFIAFKELGQIHVLGNSLGGHLSLLYALERQESLKSLILTGSSGLYESAFGTSFPRREDYEYIRKKVQLTFYDPAVATKEMVDEVFGLVNNRATAIRIIKVAKSAIRHNVKDRLPELTVPTLLIWGLQDPITPSFVGEQFNERIKGSHLEMLDECGHAPMLERPAIFNQILEEHLAKVEA